MSLEKGFKYIARAVVRAQQAGERIIMYIKRPAFKKHGRKFIFHPWDAFSFQTIEVGEDVYIGRGASLSATHSGIIIGNKVMMGPNVTIVGGDHNTAELGRYMKDNVVKRPENDKAVIIEDDVWIGAGATILKGVTLRRGCIVAACALVGKDVPPYAVAGGVPAKVLKWRWTVEEILEHERMLYPEGQRFTQEDLERDREVYKAVK
jgi:acetyltransferase-like isoleucine patch superfamily enzyme